MKTTIADWRNKIDAIDAALLRLLNERAEIVLQVARLTQEQSAPVCDPARERRLMSSLRQSNAGPLDDEAVVAIFRSIIDESRRTQKALLDRGSGMSALIDKTMSAARKGEHR